jgi:hypothetical protein
MNVRVVRVAVPQVTVDVRVAVRLAREGTGPVLVLVMLVVGMTVVVLRPVVRMLVPVVLRHVEPHADRHEGARDE